jgi:hypothetical protein
MAVFKKKKKQAPDELPDLISDDIEKNSEEVHKFLKDNEKKEEPKKEKTPEEEVISKSPDKQLKRKKRK